MLKPLAASAVAALLTCGSTACAQQPPGLPMWVIRDADSTIYLTGTVHAMKPGLPWRSAKVDGALNEATEVWFEIAEVAGSPALPNMQMLMSSGPPLSSRLTAEEFVTLTKAAEKAGLPSSAMAMIDRLKPMAAMMMLGVGQITTEGMSGAEGVDRVLAQAAKEQGDIIRGLETVDQQLHLLLGDPEEQQLVALRAYLADPTSSAQSTRKLAAAAEGWANGRVEAIEQLHAWMMDKAAQQPDGRAMLAKITDDRNDVWAGQIQDILAGKGVSFIAVGAAHLVGDQSVQRRLEARGVKVERY